MLDITIKAFATLGCAMLAWDHIMLIAQRRMRPSAPEFWGHAAVVLLFIALIIFALWR